MYSVSIRNYYSPHENKNALKWYNTKTVLAMTWHQSHVQISKYFIKILITQKGTETNKQTTCTCIHCMYILYVIQLTDSAFSLSILGWMVGMKTNNMTCIYMYTSH